LNGWKKNELAWNFSNWSESQTHSYGLNNGAMLSPWLITVMKINSGNQWTIPLGGGFGKMFEIGSQKMNTKREAYYNVESPNGAPDWSLNWTLQFLFPR
jgi:hypothetical protein